MRKKSHISLAGYLVRGLKVETLSAHKKAFYLGSVLPDLNPKMIKEPHEFATSYDMLQENISEVVKEGIRGDYNERVMWRKLGVIIHYMADYFTFPHNTSYDGSLKDHCFYERDMKYRMREFVRTPEAIGTLHRYRIEAQRIKDLDGLFDYIEEMHGNYMTMEHTVSDDCRWILRLCTVVLMAITDMIGKEQKENRGYRYLCA